MNCTCLLNNGLKRGEAMTTGDSMVEVNKLQDCVYCYLCGFAASRDGTGYPGASSVLSKPERDTSATVPIELRPPEATVKDTIAL